MRARVVSVEEMPFGSALVADASATDTLLSVEDVNDFDDSGELEIDGEIVAYTATDADANTITISPLVGSYLTDTFVHVYPRTVDRVAWLMASDSPDDGEEGMMARVPHSLWDRLALGVRDVDAAEGETVNAEFEGDEFVVTDVLSREPVVDAQFINTTTFTAQPSDGSPPASSPTPTVIGGPSFIAARWTAVTNVDPVTYEVHVSASTGFTPSGATLYGQTVGTSAIIKTLADGTALSYGTTYYVKLVAKDTDGSASAGSQGSASMVKILTVEVNTDGATPSTPAAPTIVAGPGWIQAKWAASGTTSDPLTYKVYVRAGSDPTVSDDTYAVGTTTALSLVISKLADGTALVPGTTYYVKVRAISQLSGNVSAASSSGSGSPSTVPTSGLTSDGAAPASSPTPTVKGGPTFLTAYWAPVSNNDPVQYEVHLSTSTGFTPSGATLYATTPGASMVIKTVIAGTALAYGTTYYVKIVAKDVDGSASASGQGSASLVQIDGGTDLLASSVTTNQIAANTITAADIAAGTITATEIAANTITAAKIAAGTITTTEIAANTITAADIAAATITATEIAANTITAAKIAAGTITATEIAAATITGAKIAATTITASNIAANTITAGQIAANTITATEIAADAITASEIAAGAVTTSKLEATLVLSTDIVAGDTAAAHITLNTAGLKAYAADAVTPTFTVDSASGSVYVAGRIDFGVGSRMDSDVIDLYERPSAGYQTPTLVQSAGGGNTNAATASQAWSSETTPGNELILILSIYDGDGTAPAPTTPSGWTSITSSTSGGICTYVYRTTSTTASRSGTESVTLNDTVHYCMTLLEYSGVTVAAADQTAFTANSAGSTAPASGAFGSPTSQTNDLLLAIVAHNANNETPTSPTSGFTAFRTESDQDPTPPGIRQDLYSKNVVATSAYSFSATLPSSQSWVCGLIALKAKAAQIDPPENDKLRVYALDDAHSNDASMLMVQNELGIEKNIEYPGLGKFHASTGPAYVYVHSDFLDVASGNIDLSTATQGCVVSLSGAGAGVSSQNVASAHPGVVRVTTGTTTTGHAQVRGNHLTTAYDVGTGRMRIGSLVKIPTLSDVTDRFICGIGFKNVDGTWNSVSAANSIIFRYADNINSGKWQGVVSDSSATATVDTGITVNASQWYWLEIDVASDGSDAKFYIDGILKATLTNAGTFPTGALVHHAAGIVKTAGTNARNIDCDFYYCYVEHGTRGA